MSNCLHINTKSRFIHNYMEYIDHGPTKNDVGLWVKWYFDRRGLRKAGYFIPKYERKN